MVVDADAQGQHHGCQRNNDCVVYDEAEPLVKEPCRDRPHKHQDEQGADSEKDFQVDGRQQYGNATEDHDQAKPYGDQCCDQPPPEDCPHLPPTGFTGFFASLENEFQSFAQAAIQCFINGTATTTAKRRCKSLFNAL